MSELTYEEAEDYFDIPSMSEIEKHWYRRAWESLAKKGLTTYDSREAECLVILRALTLSIIYDIYLRIEEDEYYEFGNLADLLDENITEFELGQLYAKHTDEEFAGEDNYSMDDVIRTLCDTQRPAVVAALKSDLGTKKLFYSLYYTTHTPSDWQCDHYNDEWDEVDEYDIDTCTYNEYRLYLDAGDEIPTYKDVDVYSWIEDTLDYSFD